MSAVPSTEVPLIDPDEFRAEVARLWPRGGFARLAELCGYTQGHVSLIARGYRASPEARRRILATLEAEAAAREALESKPVASPELESAQP